jgi:hypothetical protein
VLRSMGGRVHKELPSPFVLLHFPLESDPVPTGVVAVGLKGRECSPNTDSEMLFEVATPGDICDIRVQTATDISAPGPVWKMTCKAELLIQMIPVSRLARTNDTPLDMTRRCGRNGSKWNWKGGNRHHLLVSLELLTTTSPFC